MGEHFQLYFARGRLTAFGESLIAIEAEGEHAAQGGTIAISVTGKRASVENKDYIEQKERLAKIDSGEINLEDLLNSPVAAVAEKPKPGKQTEPDKKPVVS